MSRLIGMPSTPSIQDTIRVARDSVWVVNDTIQKLTNGAEPTDDLKSAIDRNVAHLKIVVNNPDVATSGEDISDLNAAITAGEAKLAELA